MEAMDEIDETDAPAGPGCHFKVLSLGHVVQKLILILAWQRFNRP